MSLRFLFLVEASGGPGHVRGRQERVFSRDGHGCSYQGQGSLPADPKKVGTMMNLEATRPIAVAITGSEEEALAFRKRAPSQKGKGKVLPHQTLSKKSRRIQKKGGSLSHLTK